MGNFCGGPNDEDATERVCIRQSHNEPVEIVVKTTEDGQEPAIPNNSWLNYEVVEKVDGSENEFIIKHKTDSRFDKQVSYEVF